MAIDEPDCDICQRLRRLFFEPEFDERIELGSWEEATSTGCETHGPIVQGFSYDPATGDVYNFESSEVSFAKEGDGEVALLFTFDSGVASRDLLLIAKEQVERHPGKGRLLIPKRADLDTIVKQNTKCLETHGQACENAMKASHTQPDFLIDVQQMCIVRGRDVPAESQYVALSYVWGAYQRSEIDSATRFELGKPYSLNRPDMQKFLSNIAKHAIFLTQKISERYLWVDALCIDHHDLPHTSRQLRAMADIYSSAVVTIVNVDGDSESGISGLENISEPRDISQKVFPFGDEQLCLKQTEYFFPDSQMYFTRGWTFQEYDMSSRKIIFSDQQVHWRCQCSSWHEELTENAKVSTYIDPRLGTILAGFPDLGSLSHIIGRYNRRDLTYEEDALPAISGLLSAVSRTFTGGFLFGLPEMYFDKCLVWGSLFSSELTRRVSSSRPDKSKLTPCGLPSWSWIGWQGLIYLPEEAGRINPRNHSIQETIPITQWYCGQSPEDPPALRRRIASSAYEQRDKYKDFSQPLPKGWERHDVSNMEIFRDEPHLHPEGCGKYCFTHPAMKDPDTVANSWYYPFPVPDVRYSTPFTPSQWPYLFCNTQRAYLKGFQFGEEFDKEIILYENSDVKIGSLNPHNEESFVSFPMKGKEEDTPGRTVELVAICKSVCYSRSKDKSEDGCTLPLDTWEVINVLWIEWKANVAYRLASGYVYATWWAALDLEDIELILN